MNRLGSRSKDSNYFQTGSGPASLLSRNPSSLYLSRVIKKLFLHMRKQKRRSAQLNNGFFFASYIVISIDFLNPKFQASTVQPALCSILLTAPKKAAHRAIFQKEN